MNAWKEVTNTFLESERYYKDVYLEKCEILGDEIEVSYFSSETSSYEIYVSFRDVYGIVYVNEDLVLTVYEEIKLDIQTEYLSKGSFSDTFNENFIKKYDLKLPFDIYFDAGDLFA